MGSPAPLKYSEYVVLLHGNTIALEFGFDLLLDPVVGINNIYYCFMPGIAERFCLVYGFLDSHRAVYVKGNFCEYHPKWIHLMLLLCFFFFFFFYCFKFLYAQSSTVLPFIGNTRKHQWDGLFCPYKIPD